MNHYNEFDPESPDCFIAYVATNRINGKRYVGITSRSVGDRWREHVAEAKRGVLKTALYAAIRKYGAGQFTVEEIACARTWEAICEVERIFIREMKTRCPDGYNLTSGGDGVVGLDRNTVERVAEMNRGRRHTEEARRRISEAGSGRVKSQATRDAIRAKHIGKKLTAEHRKKLREAKLGKSMPPRSEEHRQRISEGLRRAHARRRNG